MKKKVPEHPIVDKKINESLNLSIKEGAVSSVSSGLGFSYITPFAIAMNATSSQIGILNALINLFPTIAQLKVSKLIEKYSAKRIVLNGVLAQIILWFLIVLTGIGFYFKFPATIWILIILATTIYSLNSFTHPAWFLWMGYLVPKEIRGRYFSKRNIVVGFFGILSMILGAIFLDKINLISNPQNILFYTIIGFGILFLFALIFRIWSLLILKKTYEPNIKIRKKDYFSFWEFLKRAPSTPFGKFTIFRGFFSIGIGISVPFFELYLLRNLGFSYIWFMAIIVSGTFFQLIFLPMLGKISDRFGNVKLTKISSFLIILVPGLWFLSVFVKDPLLLRLYLLIVPSIVSGFAWAGYNLSTNNYIYDAVSPKKRCFGVSYMNITVGISMFIGSLIGTIIVWHGISFMDSILFIFLLSTLTRLAVFLFGIKYLKEVRPVKKFSSRFLIKEFRPFHEMIKEANFIGHLFEPNSPLKKSKKGIAEL
jgi:MFS family permease